MNHEWYAEDSSYSTADLFCGGAPKEALLGSAGPSCLASQIRELLGENCELDASFLEESWTSGRPVTSARYRRKRDQATENDNGVTFAELSTVGSFFFSPANGLIGDRPAYAYRVDSTHSYSAAWLRDSFEEFASRREDQAPVHDSAGYKRHAYDTGTLGSMTYQRACELLSLGEDSTVIDGWSASGILTGWSRAERGCARSLHSRWLRLMRRTICCESFRLRPPANGDHRFARRLVGE
jgi:hypothetical protein